MTKQIKDKIMILFQVILLISALTSVIVHIAYSETQIDTFFKFTILSNLTVVLALFFSLFNLIKKQQDSNATISFKNAVLLWILVTGITNHLLLSGDEYSGPKIITDLILHYFVPIGYLLNWLIFEKKYKIKYNNLWLFLSFPIIFSIASLIRGLFDGIYPYYFLNPTEAGVGSYTNVLIYIGILTISFSILGSLLIFTNRILAKKNM